MQGLHSFGHGGGKPEGKEGEPTHPPRDEKLERASLSMTNTSGECCLSLHLTDLEGGAIKAQSGRPLCACVYYVVSVVVKGAKILAGVAREIFRRNSLTKRALERAINK